MIFFYLWMKKMEILIKGFWFEVQIRWNKKLENEIINRLPYFVDSSVLFGIAVQPYF
jgi:hypothetical protein